MVQANVADLVFLPALGTRDPVAGLAIGPADRAGVFVRNLEAQEFEQLRIEGLRLPVVAYLIEMWSIPTTFDTGMASSSCWMLDNRCQS
jgi:hypothetical protein